MRRRTIVRRGPGLLGATTAGDVVVDVPGPLPGPLPGPAARPSMRERLLELRELAELKKSGILTYEEFERVKHRILHGQEPGS